MWASVCVVLSAVAVGQPQDHVAPRWVDPEGRTPITREAFLAEIRPAKPLRVEELKRTRGSRGLVAILVDDELAQPLSASLATYTTDLGNEGYGTALVAWSGGSPTDVRDSLKSWLPQGLEGAVLVGEVPVPWYELSYDQSEFPCDYYFMELDGQWTDSDGDGLFNSVSASGIGDVGPEIWVGRLWASRLSWGAQVSLLQDYFARDHTFRTSGTGIPHRALSFVDDDWDYFGDCYLDYAFDQVTVINGTAQTTAANYKAELLEGYQWVHVCSHSCPWSHTFYLNYGWGGGSVYNYEILGLQPPALFYNLFSCSATRYVETDNLGAWYIFGQPHGLTVVGSSKTGSMLDFDEFYDPLGQGVTIGEAFEQWFEYEAQGGLSGYEQSWFMGMNILGDPTLRIPTRSRGTTAVAGEPAPQQRGSWTLTSPHAGPFTDGHPALVGGPSALWMVWESGRDVRSMIYASRYDGSAWSAPELVWNHQYWDLHPSAAMDSAGAVWAAWQSYDDYWGAMNIRLAKRGLAGWSQPLTVTSGPAYQVEPTIVAEPGGIWTIWTGWVGARSEVFCRFYDGSVFGTTVNLSMGLGENIDPTLARDGSGGIWAGWVSDRSGDWQVIVRNHSAGSWWPVQQVTSAPGEKRHLRLAWSSTQGLCALWQATVAGQTRVYGSRRTGGGSWMSPTCVSTNPGQNHSPAVAVDAATGDVWACWVAQDGDGTSIWASCMADGYWTAPETVCDRATWPLLPAAAVFQEDVWLGWGEGSTGAWDLWLASSPADRVPPSEIGDLEVRLTGDDVLLRWSTVQTDTLGRTELLDHYDVFRGTHAWFEADAGTWLAQTADTTYLDQGSVPPDSCYFYVVRSVDQAGNTADDSNNQGVWGYATESGQPRR